MKCWFCDEEAKKDRVVGFSETAVAVCHECGRAICKNHAFEGKVSSYIHCPKCKH